MLQENSGRYPSILELVKGMDIILHTLHTLACNS